MVGYSNKRTKFIYLIKKNVSDKKWIIHLHAHTHIQYHSNDRDGQAYGVRAIYHFIPSRSWFHLGFSRRFCRFVCVRHLNGRYVCSSTLNIVNGHCLLCTSKVVNAWAIVCVLAHDILHVHFVLPICGCMSMRFVRSDKLNLLMTFNWIEPGAAITMTKSQINENKTKNYPLL